MTIIAIHAEIAGMQLMTVGYRLYGCIAGHDNRRIADIHCHSNPAHCEKTEHAGPDSYILISRFRKDERH